MKVVVTRSLPGGLGLLEAEPQISDLWVAEPGVGPDRRELLERVRGAHGVISQFTERVDREFYDAAGPQLKVVANYAVGYDNIDIEEATRRGIAIGNTPDAVTPSTADMAMALMLAVSRRLYEGDREVRSGAFASRVGYDPCHLLGGDFEGQTILIVGAGRIGQAVARRTIGWNMRVLYTSRHQKLEMEEPPIFGTRVSLEEGLKQADYVSLHVPLTPETRHLIGTEQLRLMKRTAYLVNTARGPVVDEEALIVALREGWIAGAGLDVFEDEPRQRPGLVDLPNTIFMPHVGSGSWKQRPLMARMAQENIIAGLRNEPLPTGLNDVRR